MIVILVSKAKLILQQPLDDSIQGKKRGLNPISNKGSKP